MTHDQQKALFCEAVWSYYRQHARTALPWRQPEPDGSFDAYKIMVSEAMLQQTQVSRVVPKFIAFSRTFPTAEALAGASLGDVLVAWSGLGYNRRAKFLWQAARAVTQGYGGAVPYEVEELQKLPGIGPNTAGAIVVYAYNQPAVFIETNIRTVFIHHFFGDSVSVADATIIGLVAETLDAGHPREWYWALMDYGAHLKQTVGNVARKSASYTRQSTFEGSKRQVRGAILRVLATDSLSSRQLADRINDERLLLVLDELVHEKLIEHVHARYHLPRA